MDHFNHPLSGRIRRKFQFVMSFALLRSETDELIPVTQEPVFAGRAEWKVDLCLAGDGVDEVHCELAADPHGIRVESLCPAGVQVNGQSVQSALLFAGDQLTIGPFDFRVERVGAESSRPVRQLPVTFHTGVAVAAENAGYTADPVQIEVPSPVAGTEIEAAAELQPDSLWLVRLGAVELGPMGWSQVEEMLERGELQPSDLACREGEPNWQAIETLLPHRRRAVNTPPGASVIEHVEVRETKATVPLASRPERQPVIESDGATESPAPTATGAAEPQYFIQRSSGEEGPLPRLAVQELVSQGTLPADTPVRLEWNTRWSNAVDLGFACPNTAPNAEQESDTAIETPPKKSAASQVGRIRWGLLAPLFYTRSLVYSLRSLSWKHLTLLILACGTVSFAAQRWMNRQARTALTGTVLLDDAPLGEVVVTFTGMSTREIAAGVADSRGSFRVLTIDGTLSPGPYRITVQPRAGRGVTVPHGKGKQVVPERYALLATSDLTIDVSDEQADYQVSLSRTGGTTGRVAGVTTQPRARVMSAGQ